MSKIMWAFVDAASAMTEADNIDLNEGMLIRDMVCFVPDEVDCLRSSRMMESGKLVSVYFWEVLFVVGWRAIQAVERILKEIEVWEVPN